MHLLLQQCVPLLQVKCVTALSGQPGIQITHDGFSFSSTLRQGLRVRSQTGNGHIQALTLSHPVYLNAVTTLRHILQQRGMCAYVYVCASQRARTRGGVSEWCKRGVHRCAQYKPNYLAPRQSSCMCRLELLQVRSDGGRVQVRDPHFRLGISARPALPLEVSFLRRQTSEGIVQAAL